MLGVFIDLSKAFDCISHNILLDKLQHYGIRGLPLNWFSDYLTSRKQFTVVNGLNSQINPILCGVPQGSILGPLLFLLYINDLRYICSDKISIVMFADDTSLFTNHKSIHQAVDTLNRELSNLSTWLKANKLTLNIKKTKYIIFRARNKQIVPNPPKLYFTNRQIERALETKFLGVHIDEYLSFKYHINALALKVSKVVGVLNKLKYFLPTTTLLKIYKSLLLPHLNYAILSWGFTNNTHLNCLLVLQKKALRSIRKVHYLHPSGPLFKITKSLNIFDILKKNIAIFMFQYNTDQLPSVFNSFFPTFNSIHNYNTRNCNNLIPIFRRTSIGQRSIAYEGTKTWNTLPLNIKQSPSLNTFKIKLNVYLLENMKT